MTRRAQTLAGPVGPVRLGEGPGGAARIDADDPRDATYALGYAHGRDRLMQLMLTRTIAEGRLSELVAATAEAGATDAFMRRLGIAAAAREEAAAIDAATAEWLADYAAGINDAAAAHRRPPEFWLAGFEPEPWAPTDALLTLKVMSYMGLAQGQQDGEKFVIQALRRGADLGFLQALFAPHLDAFPPELLARLGELEVAEPFIRDAAPGLDRLPRMSASNNWVVAGGMSASGAPLFATDPHLEINRLPAVWYEAVIRTPGRYAIGMGMPGIPGLAMGRTDRLAFGFTYGCMDMIDYFVEDCRDGKHRVGSRWVDFTHRVEVVWRKKRAPLLVDVFENHHGVLEGDPRTPGLYLCRAWSGQRRGGAETLAAIRRFQDAGDVAAAQEILADVAVSCNWLLADSAGQVGYQQSGVLPRRRHSGLHPVPGWDPAFDWDGVHPGSALLRRGPTREGFLHTTNDIHQRPGGPLAINNSSGDYRAQRIRELLEGREGLTLADMRAFQLDVVSPQARRYMDYLRPRLPGCAAGRRLAAWDGRYAPGLREPVWFEVIYARLMAGAFAARFGEGVWDEMVAETGLVNDLHVRLDAAFFDPAARWISESDRDALADEVLAAVLADPPAETWGARNAVVMRNLFLGGKLPRWAGVDVGPVPVAGGRATLNQGRVYRSHGRPSSFAPSWRMVTDMAEAACETALPGGASDRRFSGRYADGVAGWLAGEYKRLATGPGERRPRGAGPPGAADGGG